MQVFVDKHKIFKKLFILGIILNCAFFYFNAQRYLHIKIINDRVIKSRQ